MPVVKNTVKDIETALSQFKTVVISLENKQYFIKNTDGKITVEHNSVRKKLRQYSFNGERTAFFTARRSEKLLTIFFCGFC
ncbi:MAG: hypothetical protein L6V88_07325 [Anaerotruncus sp.]|nr:MAG: hypothetical protein L6V88_07325 [Anaerotruncus sp.]